MEPTINNPNKIAILGAGSWGNTLAYLLGQHHKIILWDKDQGRVRRANKTRRFKKPITQKYPDNISISSNLMDIVGAEIIINAIPLKGMHEIFGQLSLIKLPQSTIIVNASKGISPQDLKTPSEIIAEFLPEHPIAVISGPNLAKELILGKPMVTEVAAKNLQISQKVQELLLTPTLRVYTNDDVKGVELCAALKNVIAIAAGASDALKLGESARASLITRGLNEIGKFLKFYNCPDKTLFGAAGIGDLIATCSSNLSRNYRVGYFLAEGKKLNDVIKNLGEVAEGVNTTKAVFQIAKENNIDVPIMNQIYRIINQEITAVEALLNLMNRPVK
ncbi:MAG: NAD(P)-dependent glycerol-3-phosphate dehydrogenase [Candidatus Caenarcaniphilales bacterium]|nr:NAD(P)-dependent glycerol-3-phosphate dehydrogenase [Candidatus Caenarcaniphilales bacterium]